MTGKQAQPDTEPTALDLLDPAPAQPEPDIAAPPPRPRRRRKGPIEQAVGRDLALLPADLRRGGIATSALRLARELDSMIVVGRDAAGHAREIRQCLMTLREISPGEKKGDKTDELGARREARLAAAVE